MPRNPRLFIPGAIYHVYCRISRGEMALAERGEAECLYAELCRIKERDKLTFYAYCIMSNHYHISVRTDEVPLWRSMLSLQGSFARKYNRNRSLLGPLWQSRYKARIVEDQTYFDQLVAYIHLNPVAAGITEDPADYRWSGHGELLGLRRPELIDVDKTFFSFGASKGEARRQYLNHIRCCAEARWIRKGVRDLPWWVSVTDDEEIVAPQFGNEYWDYRGLRVEITQQEVALEVLAGFVCDHIGVTLRQLSGRSKRGRITEARVVLASLAVLRYGHAVKDVAGLLNKNPFSVSRWLTQASETNRYSRSIEEIDELIRSAISREVQFCAEDNLR